ncbi:MAG: hypothetical protein QOG03_2242 [Actinomycetota bacterium]|jgi:hypothetical protein|nr:hypothetical protein [Actinomycetota bacterium]
MRRRRSGEAETRRTFSPEARRQVLEYQFVLVPVLALLGAYLVRFFVSTSVAIGIAVAWALVVTGIARFIWRRLGTTVAKPLVLIITLLSGLITGAAAAFTPPPPTFSVNQPALHRTMARLRDIQVELDALPAYETRSPSHAFRSGCSDDSGDLFQPSVSREWKTVPAQANALTIQIATDLVKRGWEGTLTPDRFGNIYLHTMRGGRRATAEVYSSYEFDIVAVEARVHGDEPCRKR